MFKCSKLFILSIIILSLNGCPLSMESVENILLLKNNSNQEIEILLNLNYPDSSLHSSSPDRHMNPRSEGYLGNTLPLKRQKGLTVILFDSKYFESKWDKDKRGTPDTYLEEDKILQRYVLSRSQLDSLNWRITYP